MKKSSLLVLCLAFFVSLAQAADKPKVLFFTKSSGFQHPIIKMVDGQPSMAMAHMEKIGEALGVEIIESKDGRLITAANLKNYAAVVFYTSGDLSTVRTAPPNASDHLKSACDNAPAVSAEGKKALLDAIARGTLGYVGIHSATDCYHTPGNKYENVGDKTDAYLKMVGGEFIAHDWQEFALVHNTDPNFPGNSFPIKYQMKNEWYSFRNFADDLHVILTLDGPGGKMVGPHYQRPVYPVAWTRMHGKGRVFYTALGHGRESWENEHFISQLTGGISWALGRSNPDVTPNIKKVSPNYATLAGPALSATKGPDGKLIQPYLNADGTRTKLPKPANTPPKLD